MHDECTSKYCYENGNKDDVQEHANNEHDWKEDDDSYNFFAYRFIL